MPIPDWFHRARFGMFIHWGIYAVLGHGEQPLLRELRTRSRYETLAGEFHAQCYDPGRWAAAAREAEMEYMVLTAKHHDGFCLFRTDTTDYNAVQRGPSRDLVAEYVEVCSASGRRVGIYYSLPDWRFPAWFTGPEREPEGWRRYVEMIHRQVEELVSQYGRIDILWFDGPKYYAAESLRASELVEMIRSHQPDIVINDRLPKPEGGGDWGYETPEQHVGGLSESVWESCITSTRKFWGYHVCHEDPSMWYSQRELTEMFIRCVANGGKLLLNVGPRADGTLPDIFRRRTGELGHWVRRNSEAIYDTRPANYEFAYGGVMTQRESSLYLCFLYWPGEQYSLPGFEQKLLSAQFVDGGAPVEATQEPHRIVLHGLPRRAPDICTVIKLTFDAPPTAHPWAGRRLWNADMAGLDEWTQL